MRTFGLVGYPLGHSFSKKYFTEKFEKLNIDAEYINIEIENIQDIKKTLKPLSDLAGFNVTIPHKTSIIPFLDELDWGLSSVNAINTVKVLDDGRWKGYNTDVIGFEKSIMEITDFDSHQNAIILGSGGASKAVQLVFQKFRLPHTVVSRTPDSEKFEFSYEECNKDLIGESTLIINTTPLGMSPEIDTYPLIDYSQISSQHVCMDLVYNPEETVYLQKSKKQGATTLNGYKMMMYQADAAFGIWNS